MAAYSGTFGSLLLFQGVGSVSNKSAQTTDTSGRARQAVSSESGIEAAQGRSPGSANTSRSPWHQSTDRGCGSEGCTTRRMARRRNRVVPGVQRFAMVAMLLIGVSVAVGSSAPDDPIGDRIVRLLYESVAAMYDDSDCIFDCALMYPNLGLAYLACIANCSPGFFEFLPLEAGEGGGSLPPGAGGVQGDELSLAMGWARTIHRAHLSGEAPSDVLNRLIAFIDFPWVDPGVRAGYVEVRVLVTILGLAEDDAQWDPAFRRHLFEAILDMAADGTIHDCSPYVRVGLLGAAAQIALPGDETNRLRETLGNFEALEVEAEKLISARDRLNGFARKDR